MPKKAREILNSSIQIFSRLIYGLLFNNSFKNVGFSMKYRVKKKWIWHTVSACVLFGNLKFYSLFILSHPWTCMEDTVHVLCLNVIMESCIPYTIPHINFVQLWVEKVYCRYLLWVKGVRDQNLKLNVLLAWKH